MKNRPTYLRDAAKICPAVIRLSDGRIYSRCERDLGHDGKHKDECAHWGPDTPANDRAAS